MSGPVRAAGIVIYRLQPPHTIQYLLLQTSYGQHHWTPPKGHVDPGEDEWTAAARETKEEAGLSVGSDLEVLKDFEVVSEYTCSTPDRGNHNKKVTYYLARLLDGAKVVLSEEHQDLKWLPLEEACKLVKFDTMVDVLQQCDEKVRLVTSTSSAPSTTTTSWGEGLAMKVDARRHRFPCCIVWTPIPFLTWLFPFIGHMGICTSEGVIRDFAGPYYVSKDNMAFGWPTRYMFMDPCRAQGDSAGWDAAVSKASEIYEGRMHNLFCDNCHSHVARALNLMHYGGSDGWNMIWLCCRMLFCGKFVGVSGLLKTCLPFLVLASICVACVLLTSM